MTKLTDAIHEKRKRKHLDLVDAQFKKFIRLFPVGEEELIKKLGLDPKGDTQFEIYQNSQLFERKINREILPPIILKLSKRTNKRVINNIDTWSSLSGKMFDNLEEYALSKVPYINYMEWAATKYKLQRKRVYFFQFCKRVHQVLPLFDLDKKQIVNLALIWANEKRFVRPLENFSSRETGEQLFLDFCSHLFEKYPMPRWITWGTFLDGPFLNQKVAKNVRKIPVKNYLMSHLDTYIDVVNGASMYKVLKEAYPDTLLNRKIVLNCLHSKRLNINEVIREAQIEYLGFSDKKGIFEILEFMRPKDIHRGSSEVLFCEYMHYFATHSPSKNHFDDLYDYVCELSSEYRRMGREFKIFGRKFSNLIEGMKLWHDQLELSGKYKNVKWKSHGLKPLTLQNVEVGGSKYILKIEEITSASDLAREGRVQKHCVASYVSRCVSGMSSIWSLRYYNAGGQILKIGATIEYFPKVNRVGQIKAKSNCEVTPFNLKYIKKWKEMNDL